MRFVDWRRQARLAAALVRLAEGEDVASVARSLGYASASAFTAMFRQSLGKAPRDYFGDPKPEGLRRPPSVVKPNAES